MSSSDNNSKDRSQLVGKTGSGSFCPHEQQVHELKTKIASLEKEKEEAHKQGEQEQITKSNREIIAAIPRNLPQYRSDEDFEREVEYRVNQLNEYTSIEDLKGLYDAKLWKHAKNLAAKTASMEASETISTR